MGDILRISLPRARRQGDLPPMSAILMSRSRRSFSQ
jgi:hypothetical protein